jgi:hypothetical protein
MKKWFLIVALLFVDNTAFGQDIVVVLDSSGTMKSYGHWQADAMQVVQSVLAGNSVTTDAWQVTGNMDMAKDYRLTGEHNLYFLPFGSIAKHEWPFFSGWTKLASPAELNTLFPQEGKSFNQLKTNKALAIAVAGKASPSADGSADLIVISDFLIDADMDEAEITYVNDFEARSTSATPLILAWKKDPRVQIKFILIRPATVPPPPGETAPTAAVRLVEARFSPKPESLRLRWQIDGKADVKNYDVYVRNEKGGSVYSASRMLNNSTTYNKPSSGKLNWYVVANLMDGTQLKSAVGNVVVPKSSSGGGIFLLFLVLAGTSFIAYQWWRRKGIKDKSREPRESLDA